MSVGLDDVRALDATDPLTPFRGRFRLPDGVIYLDGNSLGPLPAATAERLADVVVREWGNDLVRSWNANHWIEAPARVGAKIAALIGARPHEVVVADSTSVNIYKLLGAALAARPTRHVILSEPGNFPTDLYMAQGLCGAELRLVDRSALAGHIDEEVAVVLLTHVHYKTAAVHDMVNIAAAAHAAGALTLWDLSHSVGAIPVDLEAAGADLAVGCGYKYLNGGPGAPAFLYVAERHQPDLRNPLSGWMGHAAPFAFDDTYAPAPGIARFLAGTPPILGLAALECGVELVAQAGMAAIDAKRQIMTQLFIELVGARCPELRLASPTDPQARGSHCSFAHPHAYPIAQALIARGVIGDFRAPDLLRFGLSPLYLRYEDVWHAVEHLVAVLEHREWDHERFRTRSTVT